MSDNRHQAGERAQLKRFVAPTMARALQLVRDEMGPEAVILSSQRTSEGVEIITSLEPDLPTRGIDVRREFGRHFDSELDHPMASDSAWKMQAGIDKAAASYKAKAEPEGGADRLRRPPAELAEEIERARERMLEARRRASSEEEPVRPAAKPSQRREQEDEHDWLRESAPRQSRGGRDTDEELADTRKLADLQSELADMRLLLEQQLWQMSETRRGSHDMPGQIKLPVGYSVINDHLKRLGLSEAISQELLAGVDGKARASEAWRKCMAQLSRRVPVVKNDLVDRGGVFAFVGPTGVGKTTTIAKLAARYVLEHGAGKVALVTTDTYRVGAHDQLRSLGRILGVPVKAVDKEHSLPTLLASLKQFPLVLIDTAGFRQGDALLREQLAQLDTCPTVKRVLVMACNSQMQTMKASVHAYASKREIDACVITKLDESLSMGEALSVLLEKSLPVAYTTDGQEIPKDISAVTGHSLVAKAVAMMKDASKQGQGEPGGVAGW